MKPTLDDVVKLLHATRADGFSSEAHRTVTASFVTRLREEGFEYHVWTIDRVKMARKFQEYGALSITTNRPGYLKEKLFK